MSTGSPRSSHRNTSARDLEHRARRGTGVQGSDVQPGRQRDHPAATLERPRRARSGMGHHEQAWTRPLGSGPPDPARRAAGQEGDLPSRRIRAPGDGVWLTVAESRDEVYVNPLRPRARTVRRHDAGLGQAASHRGGRPPGARDGGARLARPDRRGVRRDADRRPRPLGRQAGHPALLRWRLTTTDGRVVRAWSPAIDHRLTIP